MGSEHGRIDRFAGWWLSRGKLCLMWFRRDRAVVWMWVELEDER